MHLPDHQVPVFVISLRDAVHRRDSISRQLDHLGIAFEFIDAIDGREPGGENLDRFAAEHREPADYRIDISNTEIACALSHRRAYQNMIDQGIQEAIILEDDVFLEEDFSHLCDNKFEKKYDIVFFDYRNASIKRWFQEKMFRGKFELHKMCDFPWTREPFMADAYRLTLKMAEVLVAASTPVRTVTDWPVKLRHYDTYYCLPRAALHIEDEERSDEFKSLIEKDRLKLARGVKRPKSFKRFLDKIMRFVFKLTSIQLKGKRYRTLVSGKPVRYLETVQDFRP